jgi:mycoredoxin
MIEQQSITVYSTSWCGACRGVKAFLRHHNIPFDEIDIDKHREAADQVIRWSGGRRVVPTIVFRRGKQDHMRILHNPLLSELEKVLGLETHV